jgi:predicted HicB family RNase H-like nuclease
MQKGKEMQSNPIDLSSNSGAAQARFAGEESVKGVRDFRRTKKGKKRTTRTAQIGFRTTPEKHELLQTLALRTDKSITEVIEEALDLYEQRLNAEH